MADRKRRRRLMFQITAIVLPLFLALSVAVVWLFYKNSIDSYTTGQSAHIEQAINGYYNYLQTDNREESDKVNDWLFSYWERQPDRMREKISPEELDRLFTETEGIPASIWSYEWLTSLPEQLQYYAANSQYNSLYMNLNDDYYKKDFEKAFIMDTHGDYMGMVLCEYDTNGNEYQIGDRFDIDLSKHEALQKAIDSGSEDIVYELSDDFPKKGSYYVAYKPLVFKGETRAVLGIAYNWKDFKESIDAGFTKAIIIIIAGITVIMFVLIWLLYRRVVKPVNAIQDGLLEYSADKDPKEVVSKMYKIKEKNELGYLADVVSDFTLEIDFYTRENLRTQKELYDAKVQIMVSQIRPHFMYNALTSIAMMCDIDPKTAKEATITFAKYLRGNMDSLKQTKPVPFEIELEHLKKYLYIEKLRFDDLLNIEYDIQTTDFKVPMLSIQPIVENAVKHGVGMKEDGGTVKISTRETDDAFEVVISDDGVGFDVNAPKKDDGRTHVGMENTRKRLKEMCSADIIITSKVGEGTTARVIIPKERRNENEDTVS